MLPAIFWFAIVVDQVGGLPPGARGAQLDTFVSSKNETEPVKRPIHLDGIQLERDGELNKEFRQEVLLGGDPKDPQELKDMVKKMFYETDTNGDGYLSVEELEARIVNNTRTHLEEGIVEAEIHFNIVDTDKDGRVSWEEYEPHYLSIDSQNDGHDHKTVNENDADLQGSPERASFNRADSNNDGFLDSDEWLRFFHPEHNRDSLMDMAQDIFKLYDINNDGVVRREEFAAPHPADRKNKDDNESKTRRLEREAEFDKHVDANGDGIASLDELFEYINPRNAKSMATEARDLLDAIDVNGDRLLSLDELLARDRLVEYSPLMSVAEILHDDL
ncbi:hypothetical protein NECAME_04710 [Necator americanus]|uniref:EF-hand domain-containing protein n=1 Tax=Necator americanus TaxID=51031 RepID=W2SMZ1_NECAM|nr:hypothetical protein NECAME_04710 [Necator americanus]ETN71015.1 hypothetical protein NECAME_04710 [Necator americanus]